MSIAKQLAYDVDVSAFPANKEVNWNTAVEYVYGMWVMALGPRKGMEFHTTFTKFKKAEREQFLQLLCARIWLDKMQKRSEADQITFSAPKKAGAA